VGSLGLTVWTPNINIFRDPRWGRGQETPGEDPLLSGRYAVAFVENLQGSDPDYVKLSANLKHFHSYSLEEFDGIDRHEFDAVVSDQDLSQTYLPHFEMGVRAGSTGMMCSYNRINGVPGCAAGNFLNDLARDDWGFDGYITSDCYGIDDFVEGHQYSADYAEAVADAFNGGIDFECGLLSRVQAPTAVERGSLQESQIDIALTHQFSVLMRLGYFDPAEGQPYTNITIEVVDSAEHRQHALDMARESIVLLKNDGILPLQSVANIAVIGPNAAVEEELLSNYFGYLPEVISPVEGLERMNVQVGRAIFHLL
jgi:beta-glucosidase-like glycosyl hydrolase